MFILVAGILGVLVALHINDILGYKINCMVLKKDVQTIFLLRFFNVVRLAFW